MTFGKAGGMACEPLKAVIEYNSFAEGCLRLFPTTPDSELNSKLRLSIFMGPPPTPYIYLFLRYIIIIVSGIF